MIRIEVRGSQNVESAEQRKKKKSDTEMLNQERNNEEWKKKNVGNHSFSEGNSPALIRRYESTCHQVVYSEGGKQKQTLNGKFAAHHTVLLKHPGP